MWYDEEERSREDFRTHHAYVAGLKTVLVLLQDLCIITATYLDVSSPQAKGFQQKETMAGK